MEARPPVRRREPPRLEQPRRGLHAGPALGVERRALGERPLDAGAGLSQHFITEPGDVEVAAARQLAVLVEDRPGVRVVEGVAVAERRRDAADDLPVRQRHARRLPDLLEETDAPLAVGHRPRPLRPLRRGQQHVGDAPRLGRVVRVLHHDQLGAAQRGAHPLGVGQRGDGVGRRDPHHLHLVAFQRLDHLDRGQAAAVRDRTGREAPGVLDLGAVRGVGDEAVAGQRRRQAAALAPAHRVGLAGERERPRARLPDVPGGEREVDQREVLVDPRGALVRAHRPEAQHRPVRRDDARRVDDLLRVEPGHRRRPLGGPAIEGLLDLRPPARVLLDERCVEAAREADLEEQREQQRDVGAGQDGQVDVGDLGGASAPRVHDDDLDAVAVGALPRLDAVEQDRVAGLDVRAEDQECVGRLDVLVRRGRRVGAEGEVVGGDGARHAQPRVRVLVVGADEALRQLAEEVVVLRRQLPRAVEHDRVRPVLGDVAADRLGDALDGLVPARDAGVRALAVAHHGGEQAVAGVEDLAEQRALGAELALVDRVVGVASHLKGDAVLRAREQAAARAAVAAHRAAPAVTRQQRHPRHRASPDGDEGPLAQRPRAPQRP